MSESVFVTRDQTLHYRSVIKRLLRSKNHLILSNNSPISCIELKYYNFPCANLSYLSATWSKRRQVITATTKRQQPRWRHIIWQPCQNGDNKSNLVSSQHMTKLTRLQDDRLGMQSVLQGMPENCGPPQDTLQNTAGLTAKLQNTSVRVFLVFTFIK